MELKSVLRLDYQDDDGGVLSLEKNRSGFYYIVNSRESRVNPV